MFKMMFRSWYEASGWSWCFPYYNETLTADTEWFRQMYFYDDCL